MTARKPRVHGRDGLWLLEKDGQLTGGEIGDRPRRRECTWCRAAVGEPCRATNGRPLADYHDARKQSTEDT